MSDSKNVRLVEGIVEEALPAGTFRVRLVSGELVLGHLAGKMRMYHIKIIPGDRVSIEFGPYDAARGRIVRRL